MIFFAFSEKNVFIHILVSFWLSEVFDTSFQPEFWCLWDGGPNLAKFGQIWSLWPKMSIFTIQVQGQMKMFATPQNLDSMIFTEEKCPIFIIYLQKYGNVSFRGPNGPKNRYQGIWPLYLGAFCCLWDTTSPLNNLKSLLLEGIL